MLLFFRLSQDHASQCALHVQHEYFSSLNQSYHDLWRCRCTCSTIIFPHWTNHMMIFGVVVARSARLIFSHWTNHIMIFGVVAARAARLFFRIEPIISWFLALSLHMQHDYFFRIEPIISLIFGVVVARAARLLFSHWTNHIVDFWRCRCTCSTITFPHWTNQITDLCCCRHPFVKLPNILNTASSWTPRMRTKRFIKKREFLHRAAYLVVFDDRFFSDNDV